jgi:hypothetical protein
MGAKPIGDRRGFESEHGKGRTVRSLDPEAREERNA